MGSCRNSQYTYRSWMSFERAQTAQVNKKCGDVIPPRAEPPRRAGADLTKNCTGEVHRVPVRGRNNYRRSWTATGFCLFLVINFFIWMATSIMRYPHQKVWNSFFIPCQMYIRFESHKTQINNIMSGTNLVPYHTTHLTVAQCRVRSDNRRVF